LSSRKETPTDLTVDFFPSVKKTEGYSLGKSEKNERFSQRRRLSQKAHQTTAFDL
jgi:hypothetical protein